MASSTDCPAERNRVDGLRRVITVRGEQGSEVLFDDTVNPQLEPFPGFRLVDLWESWLAPGELTHRHDMARKPYSLCCTQPGQIQLKKVIWPTEAEFARHPDYEAELAKQLGLPAPETGAPASFMHETFTLDFICILSGEITCVLDRGEVTLRSGDCLVQRGTNHGWVNRGEIPCVILCVMVSAHPLVQSKSALESAANELRGTAP